LGYGIGETTASAACDIPSRIAGINVPDYADDELPGIDMLTLRDMSNKFDADAREAFIRYIAPSPSTIDRISSTMRRTLTVWSGEVDLPNTAVMSSAISTD
jgi:hypothetical protein